MGCPEKYYKQALQELACEFVDSKKTENIKNEKDRKALENIIADCKKIVSDKDFYFASGMIFHSVFVRSYEHDGNDGCNACIGGLIDFEDFIKRL